MLLVLRPDPRRAARRASPGARSLPGGGGGCTASGLWPPELSRLCRREPGRLDSMLPCSATDERRCVLPVLRRWDLARVPSTEVRLRETLAGNTPEVERCMLLLRRRSPADSSSSAPLDSSVAPDEATLWALDLRRAALVRARDERRCASWSPCMSDTESSRALDTRRARCRRDAASPLLSSKVPISSSISSESALLSEPLDCSGASSLAGSSGIQERAEEPLASEASDLPRERGRARGVGMASSTAAEQPQRRQRATHCLRARALRV